MRTANKGDTVRVQYVGTLSDGREFDSSVGRDPLELTLGEGRVIPGFEQAIVGMAPSDTRTVTIDADDAYGARQDHLVQKVERGQIPPDIELAVGTMLSARGPNGEEFQLVVTELDDEVATLDANHPLAGEALTFELTLVDFVDS